jgi:hypothetical protein
MEQRAIEQREDFRISDDDRRSNERRLGLPASAQPFLAWLIPDERRVAERRQLERRASST